MFVVTRRGQNNQSKVAAEATKNGNATVLKMVGSELKAYKSSTKGERIDGFITVDTTDQRFNRNAQPLASFLSTADAFKAHYEDLDAGYRYLIEEGIGLAQTDRLQSGTYNNGDKLISWGDGTLGKTDGSGQHIVATVKEYKKIVAGDGQRLLIEYHANVISKS